MLRAAGEAKESRLQVLAWSKEAGAEQVLARLFELLSLEEGAGTVTEDADWANDKKDRKSITGWVAKLNGDPISWSSKKQRVVALSTCEAELYAEGAAVQEVLWLRDLLSELGLHVQLGSLVYGDNQSTLAVSQNGVKSDRTKHVDVKYHFITQTVEEGAIKLKWIPTVEQQADIFTKALAPPVFERLRQQLMSR